MDNSQRLALLAAGIRLFVNATMDDNSLTEEQQINRLHRGANDALTLVIKQNSILLTDEVVNDFKELYVAATELAMSDRFPNAAFILSSELVIKDLIADATN